MKNILIATSLSVLLGIGISAASLAQSKSAMQLAEQFYAANDLVQAERYLQNELKANQKNANAHYLLGNIFARQNRIEAAQHEYESVLMLEPSGTAHQYSLQALEQLGARANQQSQNETAHMGRGSINNADAGAPNNADAIKSSTAAVAREADEKEQNLQAELDQKLNEIVREADSKTKNLEDQMHQAIDANGSPTYATVGRRRVMIYDPGPDNEAIRQQYQPRLDLIKEDARRRSEEVKAAYAEKAAAIERSAISVDRSYSKKNQDANLTLRPHGSDMYTRNYQNTGETTGNQIPVKAKPAKLLPGLTKTADKKENQ